MLSNLLRSSRKLARPSFRSLSTVPIPPHYLLTYEYKHDILEKRVPFRADHLKLALEMKEKGKLLMAGGASTSLKKNVSDLTDSSDLKDELDSVIQLSPAPVNGTFIFTDVESVQEFIKKDSYVINGVVDTFDVRCWTVAVKK